METIKMENIKTEITKIGQSPTPTIEAKAQAEPDIPEGMITCDICDYGSVVGGSLHCRRYPPTVFFNALAGPEVLFPGVKPDWYCGEGTGPSYSPANEDES